VPTPESLGGRPVLLVGNHQLFGLDLGPIVREFIVEKGINIRGLTYPGAFRREEAMAARGGGAGAEPGMFAKFGAVPVSPRNIFKLLQRKEVVLLFPGGVREAAHGRGEEYKLFWPSKTDFVRVAARFNAVVVPFGGVGADDSVEVFGKPDELLGPLQGLLPRFGGRGREDTAARIAGGGLLPVSESLERPLSFPISAPRLVPASSSSPGLGDRFYMSFGRPVDLQGLDPKDRDACGAAYKELKEAVEAEIRWLLEARQRDPYRDLVRRQIYERAANLGAFPRQIEAGPFKGSPLRSYGRRAPAFSLP